jgi:hypothetical protein
MSAATIQQLRKPSEVAQSGAVFFEVIDAQELATRLKLPKSWILEGTRSRAVDPIPCLRFGKYVRFRWQSPELNAWLERRSVTGKK